jgi:hypothetical protein
VTSDKQGTTTRQSVSQPGTDSSGLWYVAYPLLVILGPKLTRLVPLQYRLEPLEVSTPGQSPWPHAVAARGVCGL